MIKLVQLTGDIYMVFPPPASTIFFLDPLLVLPTVHTSFPASFPSFPGSRAQDHRCMLIDKSATISQWPRPFPHFSMSMPRIYSSFKSSLKKWQTCREHFRLKVCLSYTAANGFPLNGSSRLNWFIRTQNVFLISKDLPSWTKNAFFFKAIWLVAWKCEYFCPNTGSMQLKWSLYLV